MVNKLFLLFCIVISLNAKSAELLVLKVSDHKMELKGEIYKSINELENALDSLVSNRVIINTHVCLDAERVIKIMGAFSKRNYKQVSLQTYGQHNDSEC